MSKYKKVELTPRKLDEIKKETAGQMMILLLGYLMDDFDYNADRLIDIWQGVERYSEAVDNHTISLRKVADIINEHTGLNIRWNR